VMKMMLIGSNNAPMCKTENYCVFDELYCTYGTVLKKMAQCSIDSKTIVRGGLLGPSNWLPVS